MAEGVVFPFPSLPLNEGRTYGQVLLGYDYHNGNTYKHAHTISPIAIATLTSIIMVIFIGRYHWLAGVKLSERPLRKSAPCGMSRSG